MFLSSKTKKGSLDVVLLKALKQFFSSFLLDHDSFWDSLDFVAKSLQASQASLYLYEPKTNIFLLKKWYGKEPVKYSISADYEFIKYLKVKSELVHKQEFGDRSASELREPALFYFQQTLSSVVLPVLDGKNWIALINLSVDQKQAQDYVFQFSLDLYADMFLRWCQHQKLLIENKKLSELSHVKNQLLANVTHELKTPLNGILGISSALLEAGELPEDTAKHVSMIQKSGEELKTTVDNILKLVQIESKKNEVKCEKTDFHLLMHDVLSLFQVSCEQKNITLYAPKADKRLFIFVDPDQIRTVFINLLGNAVKFTEQGTIKVDISKNGEMLYVSITDTGIGIDEDKLSLIFEEFYQGDGSHTRVYGGTGLGLAIVKKIITLHSGRVWVESQKGVGSRFTFTLPMYPI
jgi:signal transduction histidine kinase